MKILAITDITDLSRYEDAPLECDGLTRVLHAVLKKSKINHEVHLGAVSVGESKIFPHYWISLDDGRIVDYRLRYWLGDNPKIPHGVFETTDDVVYNGRTVTLEEYPDEILEMMMSVMENK